MRIAGWAALTTAVAALSACGGGGGGGGGGSTTCNPSAAAAITISSTGITPTAVCVTPGGSVTFTNSDTVPHDIEAAAGCTAQNLGSIDPAQTRVVTFPTSQTCTFQDNAKPGNSAFQGTVAVNTTTVTGSGY